ncbi:MAG: tRNA uridine-5-carboxymethylaminomethyl(34) synthesis GTPase MnmE [Deltaproteobacteria bacterium]|nr:tRNA uridine-5-carboxymethylaminomethyl(34) synthesis GTPase MnmE [Deltaproteobacteria bacterium]
MGIVRISGREALRILRAAFRPNRDGRGGGPVAAFAPRRLEYGWALDAAGCRLDEALAVYMPGPHSFTGEDSAEIHCHGGPVVLEAALASVCAHGARPAGPGEFTRRACLNGRLDLSRAEAVAEMITAPTLQGARLARNKLAGGLSVRLEELRRLLDRLRVLLYAALDFPDLSQEERGDFQPLLSRLRLGLRELALSHDQARIWREGALVVLVGPPNSGKSSLFNALLGRKRALVADLPGTTRDFIEEGLSLEGLPLRLADTAGLRSSADALENAGMELTRSLMTRADIILLVMEACAAPEKLPPPADLPEGTPTLALLNKIDLFPDLREWPVSVLGMPCLPVSAESGQGLETLRARLAHILTLPSAGLDLDQAAPPSLRQKYQLELALRELDQLEREAAQKLPAEILSARLESAAGFLDEVMGISCPQEVLDQVFAGFCVGK